MPKPDPKRMVLIYYAEDDDGFVGEETIPACWAVCARCEGRGTHDHPAFSGGFTSSEWAEMCDGDPDWPEDYMRGKYDVPCSECGGRTTVLVPDEERASSEALAAYWQAVQEEAMFRAEEEAERRMGA